MQTPKEYTKNLKNKTITEDMLLDCLYSVNKRAKNCRDKIREYKDTLRMNHFMYDKYNLVDRYGTKKDEYYSQKEILLTLLKPVCVHKEFLGYEKKRIYDYQKEYKKHIGEYVWENCYFDYDRDEEVWFGDILLKDNPIYHYYLFYDIGRKYTFHSPITKEQAKQYQEDGLEIKTIDTITTHGNDIHNLVSCQFVSKIISLIQTKQFQYIPGKHEAAEGEI